MSSKRKNSPTTLDPEAKRGREDRLTHAEAWVCQEAGTALS